MQKKSIVLFSGGLDSTTCLAVVKSLGYEIYALSFNYGQKHAIEVEKAIAKVGEISPEYCHNSSLRFSTEVRSKVYEDMMVSVKGGNRW